MKINLNLLCVAALFAALTGCNSRSEKSIDTPEKLATTSEVIITEMEPDDQLYKALESFSKGDYQQSSADINDAVKSMRLIAAKANEKRKYKIEKAADALQKESDKVAKNEVKDITLLYPSIWETGRALAGNRLTLTENEYFNNTEGKAGALLTKTILQLEKSIATHHQALSNEEKKGLDDALEVAARLENGNKVDEDDLKAAIKNIDSEIDKWDKQFDGL